MSNKIETPLQRLIAELKESIKVYQTILINESYNYENRQHILNRLGEVKTIKALAESLLPYEREVIEKANVDGQSLFARSVTDLMIIENGESYFNQTFQPNE